MTRHFLALPPALLLSLVAGCSGGAGGSSTADYYACLSAETAALTAAALSKDAPKGPFSAALLASWVIEAWPAETAHEIARVTVPGTAKKLFVEGDRALVYSSTPRQVTSGGTNTGGSADAMYYPGVSGDCTYGYHGCVPAGDGTETEISIFDISDRAAPKLVRSIHSSSSLIAARRIGTTVHTVLGQPSLTAPIG